MKVRLVAVGDDAVDAMEEEVSVEFGSDPKGTERKISVCAPSCHPYNFVYNGGVIASSKKLFSSN